MERKEEDVAGLLCPLFAYPERQLTPIMPNAELLPDAWPLPDSLHPPGPSLMSSARSR